MTGQRPPANDPAAEAPVGIDVRAVGVDIDGATIIDDVDLTAAPGSVSAVIGPNGSGKSTLLRAIYRAQRPARGAVLIGGHDVWGMRARDNARLRAVLTQNQSDTADFTVAEIVLMGRSPHKGLLTGYGSADRTIVDESLARVGMAEAAPRGFRDLSGGERQRVLLARALAQRAPVILLDEPTNHLDVHAQLSLMELLRTLDATVLVALHDINQALRYADHVVVMSDGRLRAAGPPTDTVTPALLREVFGVRAGIVTNPLTDGPHVVFGGVADPATPDPAGGGERR
ncbi:ABC transporter ATP-binding protein [Gordonia sinesedis]